MSPRAQPHRRRLPGLLGLACLACLVLLAGARPAPAAEPGQEGQGGQAGEFVLGAPTSLATIEGADCLRAAELAVQEINAAGGVAVGERRLRLRLEPFDLNDVQPGQPPARAVTRLAAFIEAKNPQAIVIGPFRSEVLLEAMDLLAAKRLPSLMSIAMSPAVDAKVLGDPKYRHLFRVCLSTRYLAAYLIETMKLLRRDFGFTRVYILNQDVAWARSTASLMLRVYFERAGWQVLGQENLAEGAEDFRPALARIKEQGAQVILGIFDMPASAGLVRQWHEAKPPALLCGFVSPATGPEAWPLLGERLTGLINVIFEMGNLPSATYAPAAAFQRAFQARYGRPVQAGHGPAPAYESVHVLAEAMTRAGSLDPDRLAEALERTDRRGAMGRLRFHRGHQAVFGEDPGEEALACVVQWNSAGRRVIVHPRSVAEGRLFLPPFVKPVD